MGTRKRHDNARIHWRLVDNAEFLLLFYDSKYPDIQDVVGTTVAEMAVKKGRETTGRRRSRVVDLDYS